MAKSPSTGSLLAQLIDVAAAFGEGRDPHYVHIEPPHARHDSRTPDDLWRVVLRSLVVHEGHAVFENADLDEALAAAVRALTGVTYSQDEATELRAYMRSLVGPRFPRPLGVIVRGTPSGVELAWNVNGTAYFAPAPRLVYDLFDRLLLMPEPVRVEPSSVSVSDSGDTYICYLGDFGPFTEWWI